jgi:predicted DNA-binding transcriptional regulator
LNNDNQKYAKNASYNEEGVLKEPTDVLRGLTLKVYKYILKNSNPSGIREIQRALHLSSPTLALYHVNKLEEAGLIRKQLDGYIADRVILENFVRLKRTLIPRHFFYMIFLGAALIFLVTFFRPHNLTREYLFSVVTIVVAEIAAIYETAKALSKNTL